MKIGKIAAVLLVLALVGTLLGGCGSTKTLTQSGSFSITACAVGAKCFPQAMTQRLTPSSSSTLPSWANLPSPKKIFTGWV